MGFKALKSFQIASRSKTPPSDAGRLGISPPHHHFMASLPTELSLPQSPELRGEPSLPAGAAQASQQNQVFPLDQHLELKGELLIDSEGPAKYGVWADLYQGLWKQDETHYHVVAVKRLRAVGLGAGGIERANRMRKRVARETSLWSEAKHEHVLPFHGYRFLKDAPCLVSPWCKNGNLLDYFECHPDPTLLVKLRLVMEAAEGVVYLHSLTPPIIHGDIKPSNVMVTDEIHAAVCDFGIARLGSTVKSGHTTAGTALGSKGFMPPEVIMDEKSPSPEVDVYAFGSLILAVLSDKQPWEGVSAGRYTVAVSRGEIPNPLDHPVLPPDDLLWDIMRDCWKYVPGERPTMADVLEKLRCELQRRENGTKSPEGTEA